MLGLLGPRHVTGRALGLKRPLATALWGKEHMLGLLGPRHMTGCVLGLKGP